MSMVGGPTALVQPNASRKIKSSLPKSVPLMITIAIRRLLRQFPTSPDATLRTDSDKVQSTFRKATLNFGCSDGRSVQTDSGP
jgi:hypothetical protein